MIGPRRTLHLSLALNAVLGAVVWLVLWALAGDHPQLCKTSIYSIGFQSPQIQESSSPSSPSSLAITEPSGRCDICASDIGQRLCTEYGAQVVARTIAFNQGNTRLKRVLAKWRAGKPVRLGVLGGSNSAGQGVWADNQMTYSQLNMHTVLFNYLDSRFPQPGGKVMERTGEADQNSLVNGALGGRGTEYFAMCSDLHLPEDLDLLVLEFAVNDQYQLESTETYEFLVRYLLEKPSAPAVLEIQTFGYEFDKILTGGASHLATNLYYNVPTIAPRTLFYDGAQGNITKFWDWFYWYNPHEVPENLYGVDLRHFGPGGHRVSAELMMAYIEQQMCEMDHAELVAGTSDIDKLYPEQPLQSLSLLSTFSRSNSDAVMAPMAPKCQSVDSDSHPLTPSSSEGWERWTWSNDKGKTKTYLRATKPGAKIVFDLGSVTGRVEIYYLRSKSFGLGNLLCKLNGQENIIEGWWDKAENIGQSTRWRGLKPGNYKLECELLSETSDPGGGTEFRLMAIMSI
ncbi:hypothetical protein CcaverHIS002_0204500 [Cutaneotrichosporon cavernicola]|uniref:SGNH hydrolase-type esterase domain-containing protein n=1 Tax=Cutaneotrichosporon cavernicola TaxID=279322 RepID=A0AA48I3R8_9TREE|nr:uncharacterized protein CcaverHIS019_0204460 [Cutaneotrichosporon cavernicola]BEI81290.1 hypothetical protein CcaverHIS002_0204500 [Cutaneotrichosporon cavernicola]BEI89084.1 hypothetical protein CcaverHIS019_0204460 [Cutaneotrichosporon cavernicola]BEI96860.1 hypothetical protein CcaverHIS631_0204490 [Cutaneotrichosporon cavernicola]BEJ04632.1 hypothetical protein CcaverHIS641_0204490 [Cutaneotrichosporon cavernicola]